MQRHLSSVLKRKLKRMTIAVGMVGSDGIVLAADQRRISLALSESEFDDSMGGRKIIHVEKHKLAYAVAGDDLTDKVGHALITSVDARTLQFGDMLEISLEKLISERLLQIKEELRTLAEAYGKKTGDENDIERTLLVVFYGDQAQGPQLWRLRVHGYPSAKRVDTVAMAGARGNTGRFFEYYFQPNMPIHKLLPLASHIVLMASRIDSLMINGLDIATFTSAGFHFFTEDEKAPFRERSDNMDALIRKGLFA